MATITLVCDNRERAIQDRINAEFNKPLIFTKSVGTLKCSTRQLPIADYIIVNEETVLAAIERKTLNDYASSFKDGRHANRVKLLNLRNTTGCKLFYIVEGDFNPDYETEYQGIKYRNIHASEHDLMLEYGIFVIRTRNGEHTAKELKMLCESQLRVLTNLATKPSEVFSGDSAVVDPQEDNIPRATITFDEALIKSMPTAEEELHKSRILAWAQINGVSETSATKIVSEFALSDWILGTLDADKVKAYTFNGRKNNKFITAALAKPNLELQAKILSQLKGFTLKTSQEIVAQLTLEDILLDKPCDNVRTGTRQTKLSIERVKKIKNFLMSSVELNTTS